MHHPGHARHPGVEVSVAKHCGKQHAWCATSRRMLHGSQSSRQINRVCGGRKVGMNNRHVLHQMLAGHQCQSMVAPCGTAALQLYQARHSRQVHTTVVPVLGDGMGPHPSRESTKCWSRTTLQRRHSTPSANLTDCNPETTSSSQMPATNRCTPKRTM